MIKEILGMFTVFLAIPMLLRLRDYLYKHQNLTKWYGEDSIFLTVFFSLLLCTGIYFNERLFVLLSLPFCVYLIVPVILFSFKQWKEFLGLLNIYLNRR